MIQRTMLTSWLVEFYLGKLNALDDLVAAESASQDVNNLKVERDEITEELRQFLVTYKVGILFFMTRPFTSLATSADELTQENSV